MTSLKLLFCLFAYRPHGGLQRDFLHIAEACLRRGHHVNVLTMEWKAPRREDIEVEVLKSRALSNHGRSRAFGAAVNHWSARHETDLVVGFNRIPGLDVYYAADPCFAAKARENRSPWFRLTPRYRHFAKFERAVFGAASATRILLLSETEMAKFRYYYGTPRERFQVLPPGIEKDRRASDRSQAMRVAMRDEFGVADSDFVVLALGSGFRTKGLDRTIRALAGLPEDLRGRTRLLVAGDDHAAPFVRLARGLGVGDRVTFVGGRDDVPRLLAGSDVLLHPAYSENTGTVLLEAIVAGLPVIATDVCGYAYHIERAAAGSVIRSPFDQQVLDAKLSSVIESDSRRREWSVNGIRYGQTEDLYSMPERATEWIERYAGSRR